MSQPTDRSGSAVVDALAALRSATGQDDAAALALKPFLDVADAIVRGDPAYDRDGFIEAAAPHLDAAKFAIAGCVDRLDRLLTTTFYGDEWQWACEQRSRLEALRTLWPGPLDEVGLFFFDVEGVDDLLRQKGRHEGGLRPDQIPPGTPTSHWWWWYPAPPPA